MQHQRLIRPFMLSLFGWECFGAGVDVQTMDFCPLVDSQRTAEGHNVKQMLILPRNELEPRTTLQKSSRLPRRPRDSHACGPSLVSGRRQITAGSVYSVANW